MRTRTSSSSALVFCLAVLGTLFLSTASASGGSPEPAAYCPIGDAVFWFLQVSDPHIGVSGSNDSNRLRWIVTTGRQVINPRFVVATGDLTDSTNGNIFGYPNGPYQAEWDEYRNILTAAGVDATNYFDVPGNHDAYNDRYFAFYLANSVQGRATGTTQVAWTVALSGRGDYRFVGVNSADNTGAPFSIFFPYGDNAGLDATELSFINQALSNPGPRLSFAFGHHPITDTGQSGDTWLYYGQREFVGYLDDYGASVYGYGHTHATSEVLFTGNDYTGPMTGPGIHYDNIASLGKDAGNHYMLYAVDCDGVSAVPATVDTWPVVLITSPVNALIGGVANPYAYEVPASATNWVRALIFAAGTVSQVSFRIDGATTWVPMARVAGSAALWQGTWDASMLPAGAHTIEVRAVGTATRSDTITVNVEAAPPVNRPPVAADDAYATPSQAPRTLTVSAPGVLLNDFDPDGESIMAVLGGQPANGSVTLNLDGSFSYAPVTTFSGPDSFTYAAKDASGAVSNTATVRLTVSPPVTADTVAITSATYTTKTRVLKVQATSSRAPEARVTFSVNSAGEYPMTYSAKTTKYSGQTKLTSPPSTVTVTVRSSLGGVATTTVTTR